MFFASFLIFRVVSGLRGRDVRPFGARFTCAVAVRGTPWWFWRRACVVKASKRARKLAESSLDERMQLLT